VVGEYGNFEISITVPSIILWFRGDITNASQVMSSSEQTSGLKLKKVKQPLWFVLLMI
jgi:hypothetical protein